MADATIDALHARRHEALVIRLEALLGDVRWRAARAPEGAVGDAFRVAAEALLHEAHQFKVRGRREKLPPAPPTLGALAVELGQARARLEAYELSHSFWSARRKSFVWRTLPEPLPIARLRAALAEDDTQTRRQGDQMRKELLRRLEARIAEAYEQGYADARSGKPPPAETP